MLTLYHEYEATKTMTALTKFTEALDSSVARSFNSRRSDKDMKWKAERQYALQAVSANEKLQECSPHSVAAALATIATMGLTLAPERKHAYLIPRGKVCYATPSYMGLEYLARQTGEISNIQADLVCEKDPTFEQGIDRAGPWVEHMKARGDRGEVTHAYTVTWYVNGHRAVEVMTRAELDKVKEAAKQAQHGKTPFTWINWESEMQKKACLRRASKHWPISSTRFSRAVDAMDKAEPVDVSRPSGLLMSDSQAEGIRDLISKLGMKQPETEDSICAAHGVDALTDIISTKVSAIKRGLHSRAKAQKSTA